MVDGEVECVSEREVKQGGREGINGVVEVIPEVEVSKTLE
jgi:hypothetical protein